MSVFETLGRVVRRLEEAGLPYMVVGSIASSTHGEARHTRDVDLVIPADAEAVARLVDGLDPADWYVDAATARRAVGERRQFNLIDQRTMWKVDLIVQKPGPYHEEAFRRRVEVDLDGLVVVLQSPEDTVLSKLLWSRRSLSERQRRDVEGVLSASELDWSYLDHWAAELGLTELLEELK